MKHPIRPQSQDGFSLMELVVSMAILIPLMAAALNLFSVGATQQTTEQSSIDSNQEARAALQMMTTEIAQAGSHRDWETTLSAAVGADITNPQTVSVASTAGFSIGDWVDLLDAATGAFSESVEITALTGGAITGIFRQSHSSGDRVALFALPYATGVIPPAGMGANARQTVTTLKFYGNIESDQSIGSASNVQYVEYVYDGAANQITRSVTPVNQAIKAEAIPFIRNVAPGSVQFTLETNGLGVVTSVNVSFTVQNALQSESQTQLSSMAVIQSAMAASSLLYELQQFQDINRLPATPPQVIAWAGYE